MEKELLTCEEIIIKIQEKIVDVNNKEKFQSFFTKEFYNDEINDEEELKLRNIISDYYSKDIAMLISYVEVYAHDLPNQLYGIIETITRMLSISPTFQKGTKEMYKSIIIYEEFLISLLSLLISKIILSNIKKYIKLYKKFQCNGEHISINDIKDDEILELILPNNEIKKQCVNGELKYHLVSILKEYYKLCKNNFEDLKRDFIKKYKLNVISYNVLMSSKNSLFQSSLFLRFIPDFEEIKICENNELLKYKYLKDCVISCNEFYEDCYSRMINNEYKKSRTVGKVLFWILSLLSFVLGFLGFLSWLGVNL